MSIRQSWLYGWLCYLLLAACSTPYQEMGLSGGVKATRVDATTVRISGRGNAFTSSDTISDYVMIKAAEETLASGYGHFQVIGENEEASTSYLVSPSTATTTYQGYQATTNYTTPTLIPVRKPRATLMIKMYPGPKSSDAPPTVYDAREVMKYLSPPTN